jgi:hypothetical protein
LGSLADLDMTLFEAWVPEHVGALQIEGKNGEHRVVGVYHRIPMLWLNHWLRIILNVAGT